MLRVGSIVLNVTDARRASQFWHQALGYAYRDGACHVDATPVLVPRLTPAVAIALDERDRTHLDLYVDSAAEQRDEISRLLGLGATQVDWTYPAGADFVVLADPEGNLFCVVNTGTE
jgi:catechol 2,3-dioxygenase-like lactoylglutathione lyase family enzyme